MRQLFWIVLLCFPFWALAQSSPNTVINDLNQHYVDRLLILQSNFHHFHTSLKPYTRQDILSIKDSLEESLNLAIPNDAYLVNDNDENTASKRPILKHFYRGPAHLFEVRKPSFYLSMNPMLDLHAGLEQYNGDDNFIFLNRRGLQLRGRIGRKVTFYTDIIESQASFPTYITRRIQHESAVPGAGFYKVYNSRFTPANDDGVDYLMSQGYIGFNATKFIGVQVGHGRHFIGDGMRSLLLSDFSNNYFYLKFNTKVWKIHYQNIFAELTQNHAPVANGLYPKKYMAAHHLSINILKNLNVGLFESVIFGRQNGFDLQYLNPLILYRTVEQGLGSPDNVTMGMNYRFDFLKHCSLYGQVVIDEFVFSEVFSNEGWWANKQGVQVGLKYINIAGLRGLDAQIEYNTVRPYTYSFRDSTANYTHYNQPLAHPMGANFRELMAVLRYQPVPKLFLKAQLNYANYGLDTLGSNWGGNVHQSYSYREQEYGNKTTQGVETNLLIGQFQASYMLKHNLFVDLNLMYRKENAELDELDNNSIIFSAGFRWNMFNRQYDW